MILSTRTLEVSHLIVTWALTGLIWTIQLVHYPSFSFIDVTSFHDFQMFHMQSISLVVIPLMVSELTLAIVAAHRSAYRGLQAWCLGIVLAIWMSTFFWQMPLHNQLLLGKNQSIIDELVAGNALRTGLWSLKAVLLSSLALRDPASMPTTAYVRKGTTR